MKNLKIKFFIATTIVVLLNSCVAYYPQVVDIPLIKGKGDIRVNAGYFIAPSFSENINTRVDETEEAVDTWVGTAGIHSTVSAGITELMSFQGFLSFDATARIHLQVAFGVYNAFEDNTVIELYGGWGYGNGYMNTLFKIRDDYNMPFAQFNIGKSGMGKTNMDYGLGIKSGYLFCDFNNVYNQSYIHKKDGWIIEPSVFFRVGGRRVKFNATVNYLWTETIVNEYYFPINIGMGVNFTLGKISKKD